MTRDEFKAIALQAIETVTTQAERRLSRPLPRRYSLAWLGGPVDAPGEDVAELLVAAVFVSKDEIYPCVDLSLEDIDADGRLRLVAYRATYTPCPFGEHWRYKTGGHDAGRAGPFKLGAGSLVDRLGGP